MKFIKGLRCKRRGRYPVRNGKRNRERKIYTQTAKDKLDKAFSFLILFFFFCMNASNVLCALYICKAKTSMSLCELQKITVACVLLKQAGYKEIKGL